MTEHAPPKVATDIIDTRYVRLPGSDAKRVALLVSYEDATDGLWVMEERTVTQVISALCGNQLGDESIKTLTELARTEIVTHRSVEEDDDGDMHLHLTLYGQVESVIPLHEADSAVQMLAAVLHAQGHKELGD